MPRTATPAIPGVDVTTPAPAGCEPILSADALRFVASLARRFEPTRRDLLAPRPARPQEPEAGRLAPGGEARPGGRPARLGVVVRLRPVLLPHCLEARRARHRAVLVPPQAREPPRGAALERRVQLRAGRARTAPRHHSGDRA